jgi:molybdenum cofactor cytidylyltransferase
MIISAVVLAAGGSTRMGTQKLLLPLAGVPIVRHTVSNVLASGADEVIVVVGFEPERVAAALEGLAVRFAHNPNFTTGMGGSFRAGVEALGTSDAAMFALADQPFVGAADYRQLIDVYRARPGGIVCARYGEVTAPPHIFSRAYFPELAVLEHGARPVLQRHGEAITVVPLAPDLLTDIDTPEDYERAVARAATGSR